jgi:flavin-dependent dehydrogenase
MTRHERIEGIPPGGPVRSDEPPPVRPRYDVAIVGGGPAGATAAALLARAGLAVACFERERFPRFHVGESLLPASLPLFERLGVVGALEAAGFLRKYGAAFIDDVERRRRIVTFRRGSRVADHAYNVPRADFDRLLLEHAVKEGAAVFQGAEVETVGLEAAGVRLGVRTDDGGRYPVEVAFLVDASGRDALVASRLGRREAMPGLGKVALFAHYRGAERWRGRAEGHIRIYLFEHGWFWWIPFAGDLTSVGCVLHQRVVASRPASIEVLFEEMIAACPSVRAGLEGATGVSKVWRVANFSYRATPAVGDRFVAIGDAVTFVDPIFSTGVYIAMQCAELAAPTIVDLVRSDEFRASRFDTYRERVARGTALFFRLIERYYDPSFLDVFFSPRPPPVLGRLARDAFRMTVAGGAFLVQPAWVRLGLAAMFLAARLTRRARRRRGLPVDSRLPW